MNETQSSSMVLASKSSESAVEVTETIETEVKRPKKGSGLELSWTVKGDEKEAKGKARVKHNEVVAVKTTTSEGKPALLLMRPKRVHD